MLTLGIIGWIVVSISAPYLLGWWYLPVLAVFVALLLVVPMAGWWSGFTGSKYTIINASVAVAVAGGILSAMFLGVNFIGGQAGDFVEHKCKVVRFYRSEHHRTHRVGRRTYVTDRQPYYRYHAEVVLPDSSVMDFPVTESRYRHAHHNDSIYVKIHSGLLGVDYITQ